MWKKKPPPGQDDDAPEDGQIEVFATEHGVQLTISVVGARAGDPVTTMYLSPDTAYTLAQRITLAGIRVEDSGKR